MRYTVLHIVMCHVSRRYDNNLIYNASQASNKHTNITRLKKPDVCFRI